MAYCIAGFGEVMLRLCPQGKNRFAQNLPGELRAGFGGGEANVCASVAILGGQSKFLTSLPDNPIARAFARQLGGLGCDTSAILYSRTGRMGVYYAEHGSNMRGSSVLYDRDFSTISMLPADVYDFPQMLAGVTHLHLTGITAALSKNAYESSLAIAGAARSMGITVSVDLNYRKKLWNWEQGSAKNVLAARCMEQIVKFADIIVGNEEDAQDVFGLGASGSAIDKGLLNVAGYKEVATRLSGKFPQARHIAITLRESISADHNNWGGMLYDCAAKRVCFAPFNDNGAYEPFQIRDIVDRFGGGDSFCAGLLLALNTPELSAPATAIQFAVAASALKHTFYGDYNYATRADVENLMKGAVSGRVQR